MGLAITRVQRQPPIAHPRDSQSREKRTGAPLAPIGDAGRRFVLGKRAGRIRCVLRRTFRLSLGCKQSRQESGKMAQKPLPLEPQPSRDLLTSHGLTPIPRKQQYKLSGAFSRPNKRWLRRVACARRHQASTGRYAAASRHHRVALPRRGPAPSAQRPDCVDTLTLTGRDPIGRSESQPERFIGGSVSEIPFLRSAHASRALVEKRSPHRPPEQTSGA